VTRPATVADADAVEALFDRSAVELDETRLPPGTVATEWQRPGFDPARDHWLEEAGGDVVGYAALRPGGDVTFRGEVTGLLPLLRARARDRGDERLETITTTRAEDLIAALEADGWARPRDVHRMWVELDPSEPAPAFPDDVAVRPYTDDDARRLHAFLELAYAQNNERTEPFDEWKHFMTQPPWFEAAYWHLAESQGAIAGCALTWAPEDGAGWIKDLAVHPDHRRRGLGEALLHHAHRAYRAAGVSRVGLKVDSDNPSSAGRLYARLGYVTDRLYAILTTRP
jgi:mycothiol synthase